MTLNLRVMAPNRIVWNSEVEEVILSSNSGQIGILPNHAPLLTALNIGVMKIRVNSTWIPMALMGGFAQVNQNEIIVLVNEAEKASEISIPEALSAFEFARESLDKAVGKRQQIEANLTFQRAKARLEAAQSKTE